MTHKTKRPSPYDYENDAGTLFDPAVRIELALRRYELALYRGEPRFPHPVVPKRGLRSISGQPQIPRHF